MIYREILKKLKSQFHNWEILGFISMAATLVLMPFPRSWSLYSLGLFIVCGFWAWVADFKIQWNLMKKQYLLILPFILLFLLHFIFVIAYGDGISKLEDRLMLILVPIFGLPLFASDLFRKKIKYLYLAFIAGILIIIVYQIFYEVYLIIDELGFRNGLRYLTEQPGKCFNRFTLSLFEHTSYISMKVLWAVILVMLLGNEIHFKRIISALIVAFLSVIVFLLASRAGIIAWLVVLILLSTRMIRNRYVLYTVFIGLILVTAFFTKNNSKTVSFYNQVGRNINQEKVDWKNFDVRTRIWFSAAKVIKENPFFGVGPDHVRERLTQEYSKEKYEIETESEYNAHNQFLEVQLGYGIAGTFIFLWMFFLLRIHRKRMQYPLLSTMLMVVLFINFLFESMLNRQWGLMFFMIFYCLMLFSVSQKKPLRES